MVDAATQDDTFPLYATFGGLPVSFRYSSQGDRDYYAEIVRRNGLATYEAPTPAVIAILMRGSSGCFIDVGAHTGLLSLVAAAAAPNSVVHAFEPLLSARRGLHANLKINPALAPRLRIHDVALSDRDGELTFYETINDRGFLSTSSSIEQSHARNIGRGEVRENHVSAVRLDAWAADHLSDRPIRLIKIDVESHEHAVLAGGMGLIAKHRPMIIVEVLPGAETGAHTALLEQGYLNFVIKPNALLQRLHVDYFHGAANHLLCPNERAWEIFTLCRVLWLSLEVC